MEEIGVALEKDGQDAEMEEIGGRADDEAEMMALLYL